MAQERKSVLERVYKQAEEGKLADDVTIVYRVRGGVPGGSYDESVVLTASGSARICVRDELDREPSGEVREEIGPEVVLQVCRLIAQGSECLIPASEARFLPDSLVGSISVGIGDESETFYFEADEENCEHMGRPMPNEVRAIRDRFKDIELTCLPKARSAGKD